MSEVSDPAWDQYVFDRAEEALASKGTLFFRSIFVPSLACALNPARARNGESAGTFADQLEQHLKRLLANRAEGSAYFRSNCRTGQEGVIVGGRLPYATPRGASQKVRNPSSSFINPAIAGGARNFRWRPTTQVESARWPGPARLRNRRLRSKC